MITKPLKFPTVVDLQTKIDSYFNDTPKDEWTITGLALSLDTTRQTLINYEDERPEYLDTIKKAKLRVENGYEIDLKKSGRSGTIFALKNFDWKDTTNTDLTSKGEKIMYLPSELINKNIKNDLQSPTANDIIS